MNDKFCTSVHSFQSENLCLFKAYHIVPTSEQLLPPSHPLSIMLQNEQYCINWNLTDFFSNANAVSFSVSVIKPSNGCISPWTKLGRTLHTLNRGKLSPEKFASSVQLGGEVVFKEHRLHCMLSADLPRFTVRKTTTVVGRVTKH